MNHYPLNYIVCIINLLLIPTISLFIYARLNNIQYKWNMDFVIKYSINIVCNFILTHIFVVFFRHINKTVYVDGSTYTFLAIIVACFLGFAADFLNKSTKMSNTDVNNTTEEEK